MWCGCGYGCGFEKRCGFGKRCGYGAGAVLVRVKFFAHFGQWLMYLLVWKVCDKTLIDCGNVTIVSYFDQTM